MVERVEWKPVGWKKVHLSKGRWLTLLKNTLQFAGLLSLFGISTVVAKWLEGSKDAFCGFCELGDVQGD